MLETKKINNNKEHTKFFADALSKLDIERKNDFKP